MMQVLLVRHGESMGNVDPEVHHAMADHAIPLSPRGEEQAREAGRRIASFFAHRYPSSSARPDDAMSPPQPHVRLWTSPYKRARQTADLIQREADRWIVDRREHILLCEQQFGLFEGLPDEDLPRLFPVEYAHYQKCIQYEGKFWARMPLGESRFDVAARVHQAFGSLQRDRNFDGITHLVVVLHGVTMRAFVMMWCHYTPEWFEAEPNPGNGSIWLLEGQADRGYLYRGEGEVSAGEAAVEGEAQEEAGEEQEGEGSLGG